jgi:BioD-like phosphotransacetylase family protein
MATLQLLASQPHSGKTTAAVAFAQGLARAGRRVRLVRAGSGEAASEDAATFATYLFATSTGQPVAADKVPSAASGETLIVELDAGAAPLASTSAVVAVRGAPTADDEALAKALGERLIGSIATCVAPGAIDAVARALTDAGLRPLALIAEDRILAAPCVAEIRGALGARLLYEGENELETVEDVLIGPVYADPARPHFRRFESKAVLAPFNKTDLHLAAIETQAACLVITGGHDPSPYVVDRAQHGTTTVLLAPGETPETLASLGDVWLTSRFRGERKAAAAFAALEGRVDFAALAKKIEG